MADRTDRTPTTRAARRAHGDSLLPALFAFSALVAAKIWLTRAVALGDWNPLRAFGLEAGFVLLLATLVAIAFPRRRRWGWLALDALFTLACVVIIVFAKQFEEAPTLATLQIVRELGGQGGSVQALLRPAYLLFLLDLPLLAVAFAVVPASRHERTRLDRRLLVTAGVSAAWVAVVLVSMATAGTIDDSIVGARVKGVVAYALLPPSASDSIDIATPNGTPGPEETETVEASAGATPKVVRIRTTTNGPVDLGDPLEVQGRIDGLQAYFGRSSRIPSSPPEAVAKGHSVIMIQMESLSAWMIGLKVGGREVTPNMNRLLRECWYTPNMVTEIGRGNTSDAEFTANTSLLADRKLPSSYLWRGKAIPSLPRLARKQGYEAMTFHTNVISYWRRDLLYPSLGFSRWYAAPSFPRQDIVGPGSSDQILFTKVAQVLEAKHRKKEPFLAEAITLDAHFPYFFGASHTDFPLPASVRGSTPGQYAQAVHFQDQQLGAFIRRLKRDGLWDDAVVVIYGDHFGVRPTGWETKLSSRERQQILEVLGRPAKASDSFTVPFLLHLPGQTEGHTIPGLRAQVDIMPTVADVLGIDLSQTPHIGASVFDNRKRTVVMRYYVPDGTFVTNEYLFRPGLSYKDGNAIRLSDSKAVARSEVPESLYKRVHALCAFNTRYLRSLPALKK